MKFLTKSEIMNNFGTLRVFKLLCNKKPLIKKLKEFLNSWILVFRLSLVLRYLYDRNLTSHLFEQDVDCFHKPLKSFIF